MICSKRRRQPWLHCPFQTRSIVSAIAPRRPKWPKCSSDLIMNSQFKATVIFFGEKRSIFYYWSFKEFEHNTVAAKLWFCLDRRRLSLLLIVKVNWYKFMAHSAVWGHPPIQRQNTNSKKLTIEKLPKCSLRRCTKVKLIQTMNEE